MLNFISGATMMGFLVSSLWFLRFWSRTRDQLFLMFSIAFLLFAVERWMVVIFDAPDESHGMIYLLRLCGFILIIVGIVHKNRGSKH